MNWCSVCLVDSPLAVATNSVTGRGSLSIVRPSSVTISAFFMGCARGACERAGCLTSRSSTPAYSPHLFSCKRLLAVSFNTLELKSMKTLYPDPLYEKPVQHSDNRNMALISNCSEMRTLFVDIHAPPMFRVTLPVIKSVPLPRCLRALPWAVQSSVIR